MSPARGGTGTRRFPASSALVANGTLGQAGQHPNRLVPVVCEPDDIMVAVSGDPLRTNAYVFAHNGILGYPTTKTVTLPREWPRLLREARER